MELALSVLSDDDPKKQEALKLFEKAKAFKIDPVKAMIAEAGEMMEPDQREKLQMAVKIYETYKAGGSIETLMPVEYKGYYEQANQAIDKAKDLKTKKNEMQISLITKAVTPIWAKKDTQNLGYITKTQCCELVQDALKAIGQEKYYDEKTFAQAFDFIILAGDIASGNVKVDDIKQAAL